MRDLITHLATGFGLGDAPILPGTVGALPGILLAFLVLRAGRAKGLALALMFVVLAFPICHVASGSLDGGDASRLVADEFLLFPVAVAGIPLAGRRLLLVWVFVVFRIFDSLKPGPLALAELLPGGIVLDDLFASVLTWLVFAVSVRCRPERRAIRKTKGTS
jgi:phosphatidylglycerophosphatase A